MNKNFTYTKIRESKITKKNRPSYKYLCELTSGSELYTSIEIIIHFIKRTYIEIKTHYTYNCHIIEFFLVIL